MNRTLAERVANAVLYEGYILYPYRPSVKNRQRWTFGGLYPESYCRGAGGSDAAANQTECLVRGDGNTTLNVIVRFLHLTARQVGAFDPPLAGWPAAGTPQPNPVEMLRVGERTFHTWEEAEEREVVLVDLPLGTLLGRSHVRVFSFPGCRWQEPITAPNGSVPGLLTREQATILGEVEVLATVVGEGLLRLTVVVRNRTPLRFSAGRGDALVRTLVSTHVLLGTRGGEFISLLDPPEECREVAAGCHNVGVWPVLLGEEGQRDTMLSSPIILYDYPQIAPESRGDLFDSTEIDEILSLRVLTLTDEEKRQAADVDERARALLARTESLGAEELLGLHGTIRSLRPVPGGAHE